MQLQTFYDINNKNKNYIYIYMPVCVNDLLEVEEITLESHLIFAVIQEMLITVKYNLKAKIKYCTFIKNSINVTEK